MTVQDKYRKSPESTKTFLSDAEQCSLNIIQSQYIVDEILVYLLRERSIMRLFTGALLIILFFMGTLGTASAISLQEPGLLLPDINQIALTSKEEIPHHVFLANQFLKAGRYQECITICEQILQVDKNNIAAHSYSAAALKGLGEIKKYQEEEALVKELSPESPLPYQALATLYLSLRDKYLAEKTYVQGIETSTDTAKLHMELADLYINENQFTKAESHYQKVLEQKNLETQLFLNANFALCKIELYHKEYDKVIKRATVLTDLYPPLPQGYLFLGEAYLKKDQPNKAIDVYKSFMKINPESPIPYQKLSSIYLNKLNAPEKSLDYAREATKMFPQNANSWDTLGWVLFKNSQYSESLEQFSRAITLENNNPQFLYHLGLAQQKLGKKNYCKKTFNTALELIDPAQLKAFANELETRIEQCN